MSSKYSLSATAIGIALSIGVLAYLFSSISIQEVVDLVLQADARGVALFLVLSLSMSFFRCWRYLLLLKVSGYRPRVSSMFLVVLVRNLFTDLLPARIGSLIYVFLVTTRLGIPMDAAVSSFAQAFVFDLLAVVPLILAAAYFAGGGSEISIPQFVTATAVLGAVFGVLLLFLPRLFRILSSVVRSVPFIPARIRDRIAEESSRVEQEIQRAQHAGIYGRVMFLSILVRVAKYAALYVFLYALLAPRGYTLAELPPAKVFIGICAAELSASLPIAGIAGFGLYQGTWLTVFQFLGFPERIAKLTSVSHHLFTQAYGYSLGIAAFLVLLLPALKVARASRTAETRAESTTSFSLRLTASVACITVLVFAAFFVQLPDSEAISAVPEPPSAQEEEALRAAGDKIRGAILFDSNRSGTFGIYRLDLKTQEIRAVLDTPRFHEVYPDPSPDKRSIVFASQRSPAKEALSDIWMINWDGTGPRRIAENGTFPTFSTDGKRVFFERDRRAVIELDLQSGKETEIFPANAKGWGRHVISKPRLSPDEKHIAFTADKPRKWNAWYMERETGSLVHIEHGCEPTWMKDGKSLLWVKKAGSRERSGLYRYSRAGEERSEFHDRDAPFGHEYFPSVADDRFLVFSACPPGQHAHETANYQLFLNDREKGTTVRLTYDTHTNRWPKLVM